MVEEDLRLSHILTRAAFENAVRVNAAIGGSTNEVIHLLALAGRAEVPFTLDDIDALGRDTPLLIDLMPSGRFLMEDFFEAGGLPVVLRELGSLLHREALTVTGHSPASTPQWLLNPTTRSSTGAARPSSPTRASPSCAATSPPTAR